MSFIGSKKAVYDAYMISGEWLHGDSGYQVFPLTLESSKVSPRAAVESNPPSAP